MKLAIALAVGTLATTTAFAMGRGNCAAVRSSSAAFMNSFSRNGRRSSTAAFATPAEFAKAEISSSDVSFTLICNWRQSFVLIEINIHLAPKSLLNNCGILVIDFCEHNSFRWLSFPNLTAPTAQQQSNFLEA